MTTTVSDARDLGDAVRKARLNLGLSQAELAHDARVGRQWLVGLEAGDKTAAPFDMVMRVLRELRLPVLLDPTQAAVRRVGAPAPVIRADDIIARFTDPNPR
ncbi:MAG: helix-turn-helix domain-containing protein [Bifidobacteriaceae bacterium]|nr:helix-turn-helix domain-containing protein [Bifidobacteriaceae bacterium]